MTQAYLRARLAQQLQQSHGATRRAEAELEMEREQLRYACGKSPI